LTRAAFWAPASSVRKNTPRPRDSWFRVTTGWSRTKAISRLPARHVTEAGDRIVALYKACGKSEQAEDWRRRLAKASRPAEQKP
jgi:hypothetical protein